MATARKPWPQVALDAKNNSELNAREAAVRAQELIDHVRGDRRSWPFVELKATAILALVNQIVIDLMDADRKVRHNAKGGLNAK